MGCKATLGELCTFHRGASVPRARMFNSGNYLYIHYGDLYRGFEQRIDVEDPAKPLPFILDSEKIKETQFLHDQDIVYVLTSETVDDLGHAFLFNNPRNRIAVSGTETTIVRIQRKDMVLPAYLNYVMQSPRFIAELRQYVRGMKVFRVHPNDVARISVDLPSLDKQAKVVAILDAIFEKRLINNRLNGYLYNLMDAMFQKQFRHSSPRYGSIYDIADVIYGAAFKSSLFNEGKEGYPLIRIRDLTTFSPQFYTCEEHPKRTFIKPGDVVAGMDAEFSPTFWLGEEAVLNQRVCCFAPPKDTSISRSYLLFALKPLLAFIQNYASGTTVAHMGKSDLEALKVPLPTQSDLEQFASVAEPMRHVIVGNATENARIAMLRDTLLPKLMSGEIDVSKVDLMQLNSHLADC